MLASPAFTLFDFLSYILPGAIVLWSLSKFLPYAFCFRNLFTGNGVIDSAYVIAIISVCYLVGHMVRFFSKYVLKWFYKTPFGVSSNLHHDFPEGLRSAKENKLLFRTDKTFRDELRNSLKEYWGAKIAKNCFQLCLRLVEEKCPNAYNGQIRRQDLLYYFHRSLIIPFGMLFAATIFAKEPLVYSLLSACLCVVAFLNYRYHYRFWVELVYRVFYIYVVEKKKTVASSQDSSRSA